MSSGVAGARRSPRRSTPLRTCLGCRRVASPSALVRVARRPDGALAVGRHEPGRGAWLCAEAGPGGVASRACFEAAVRRRAFGRALRREVGADELLHLRGKLIGERDRWEGGDLPTRSGLDDEYGQSPPGTRKKE